MTVLRPVPTVDDVSAYLGFLFGATNDTRVELIDGRLPIVTAFVQDFTRGVGFSTDGTQCAPGLFAVIVSATAREVSQLDPGMRREEVGSYNALYADTSQQFLLREVITMQNYRRMSA